MAALPLNGRSYTDLLALQPGVMPESTITSLTVQGLGQSVFSPSGDLNPGTLSINGQREQANGFMVNGADAEETGSLAAAVIPNLDSIAEFRILSDNFDAEYGRYTGGQINVITKAGTNDFMAMFSNSCGIPTSTRATISRPLAAHLFKTSSAAPSAVRLSARKFSFSPITRAPGRFRGRIRA